MSRRAKYRNKRTVVDGIKFQSIKESVVYGKLKILEQAGKIKNLRLQVPFVLAPQVVIDGRKKPALRYFADFVYEENGKQVIVDVKGIQSQSFKIKRHLMLSVLGLEITIV